MRARSVEIVTFSALALPRNRVVCWSIWMLKCWSRVSELFASAPTCCQVAGRPGNYLTSSKRQHTTFHAGGGALLGLRVVWPVVCWQKTVKSLSSIAVRAKHLYGPVLHHPIPATGP